MKHLRLANQLQLADSAAEIWTKFEQSFSIYMLASGAMEKENLVKAAVYLIYQGGKLCVQQFATFRNRKE